MADFCNSHEIGKNIIGWENIEILRINKFNQLFKTVK